MSPSGNQDCAVLKTISRFPQGWPGCVRRHVERLLYRLGHWSVRHRRRVVLGWLAVFAAVIVAVGRLGWLDERRVQDPRHRVAEGARPARGALPGRSRARRPGSCSLRRTARRSPTERTGRRSTPPSPTMADAPGVVGVVEPVRRRHRLAGGDDRLRRRRLRASRRQRFRRPTSTRSKLPPHPAEAAGIQVEFGGDVGAQEELGHTSELIGLGVAVVVLLFSFGSVVAMGLPIAVGAARRRHRPDRHHAGRRLHRPLVDGADAGAR